MRTFLSTSRGGSARSAGWTATRDAHAVLGHLADTAGAIGLAFVQAAHGVLAGRGEWVTNEKTLIDRAGLRSADDMLEGLTGEPDALVRAVAEAHGRIQRISG
jgi:hypothetical protein